MSSRTGRRRRACVTATTGWRSSSCPKANRSPSCGSSAGRPRAFRKGKTIDPARRASAQAELRSALEKGERALLLAGAAGSGKTTLLHALASELAPRRKPVYLAQPRLPLGGFWMRLAGELDLEAGYDAKRRVLRRAAELAREGGSLLLLVDDAELLPAETLYALLAAARSEPGLQLVLARSDASALAGPLPDDVQVVRVGGVSAFTAEASAAPPEPAAVTLPALSARRRSRERRARLAWGAGGALAGLVLGLLLAGPVARELGPGAGSAPETPDVAASPMPPTEEAAPLAASERELGSPPATTVRTDPEVAATPSAAPATSEPRSAPSAPAPAPPAAATPPAASPPVGPPPSVVSPAPAAPSAPVAAPPAVAAPPPAASPRAAATLPPATSPPSAPPAAAASEPAPASPSPATPAGAEPPVRPPAPEVASPPPPRRSAPLALGRLSVTSDSHVRIEIDGRAYGPAPVAGIQLPRGEHRVLAYYDDGSVGFKTVHLDDADVSVFFR